jgi:hypothetical protein
MNSSFQIYKTSYAGKGIRTPARFHVAVFETAALPLGYPGNRSRIIFIIKQMDKATTYNQYQKVHFEIVF